MPGISKYENLCNHYGQPTELFRLYVHLDYPESYFGFLGEAVFADSALCVVSHSRYLKIFAQQEPIRLLHAGPICVFSVSDRRSLLGFPLYIAMSLGLGLLGTLLLQALGVLQLPGYYTPDAKWFLWAGLNAASMLFFASIGTKAYNVTFAAWESRRIDRKMNELWRKRERKPIEDSLFVWFRENLQGVEISESGFHIFWNEAVIRFEVHPSEDVETWKERVADYFAGDLESSNTTSDEA